MFLKVVRWTTLCVVTCVFLFSQVSCGKVNHLAPSDEGVAKTSPYRGIFWYPFNIGLVATEDNEQGVDITNVILDKGWINDRPEDPEEWTNGACGYVLSTGSYGLDVLNCTIPGEINVVAWSERNVIENFNNSGNDYIWYEVGFKVYGVDTTEDPIDSNPVYVPYEYWQPNPPFGQWAPESQGRPKVTAFIRTPDPEEQKQGPLIMVAITFQRKKSWGDTYEREVCWALYEQTEFCDIDNFTAVVEPEVVAPNQEEWALHPDICYGVYFGGWDESHQEYNPDFEAIFLTYEEVPENGHSSVYLAELHEDGGWGGNWEITEIIETEEKGDFYLIPSFPRIDIGLDSSYYEGLDYYVGAIVWWEISADEELEHFLFNIKYGGKPYNIYEATNWIEHGYIDELFDGQEKNGLPYVDIDPLENCLEGDNDNYSHVVWSKYMDEWGVECEPYYINSYDLLQCDPPEIHRIYNAYDYIRSGLPTIAAYTDQEYDVGTIQFLIEEDPYQYPIYSTVLSYYNYEPETPDFTVEERISYMFLEYYEYTTEAANWTLGPSNAVRGDDNTTVCVWTEMSLEDAPDIYADVDE